jgi:hypothetical protein
MVVVRLKFNALTQIGHSHKETPGSELSCPSSTPLEESLPPSILLAWLDRGEIALLVLFATRNFPTRTD